MTRFGIGYDAHRLMTGRPLVLGGVLVPHHQGLDGHSDADVLCHAIADALLGAASLGDLGGMYPASDETWRNASSLELLRGVAARLRDHHFTIVNIDSVIVADAPRLAGHIEEMRANLAAALEIGTERVSVKPKSNEGLGMEGRGEGMSAQAVASIEGAA